MQRIPLEKVTLEISVSGHPYVIRKETWHEGNCWNIPSKYLVLVRALPGKQQIHGLSPPGALGDQNLCTVESGLYREVHFWNPATGKSEIGDVLATVYLW